MFKKGPPAWQRIRDLVAENRRLAGEVKRLAEKIRRMERAFEEVRQAYEQHHLDLAASSNSWQVRRQVEQRLLEFIRAVIPVSEDLERRAAEAATDARRHHIRSFFKRLIQHTRVNRPESP